MTSNNNVIAITIGDPAGIGPEVAAKALRHRRVQKGNRFIVIGNNAIFEKYRFKHFNSCHFIHVHSQIDKDIEVGQPNQASGKAALDYLKKAVELMKKGHTAALVTAPLSKEAIHLTNPTFQGHTEFLAESFSANNIGMMFVCDELRIIIATRHIALKDVPPAITSNLIRHTIDITLKALQTHYRIVKPRIAVCGLNPHAGESGAMGDEEKKHIIPVVENYRNKGVHIEGPFPADTLFTETKRRKYDAFIAMYHDQGLIPIKSLFFNKTVNLTVGLPFIRTSPAHGTAYDIAGKNLADPQSMIAAIIEAKKLIPR